MCIRQVAYFFVGQVAYFSEVAPEVRNGFASIHRESEKAYSRKPIYSFANPYAL